MKKITHFFLFFVLFGFYSCSSPVEKKKEQVVSRDSGLIADSGMVVCAREEASKVGIVILKKGGNAVDAAVAVQFALAVVYPNAGNIGGGGFMVLRMNNGEINSLDYREKAPMKASRDMYLDKSGNVVENMSGEGLLSAGVPGSVDGMVRAHEKYGKLPWKELVQPAIDLAEKGFTLTDRQATEFNNLRNDFLKWNTVYLKNEKFDPEFYAPLVKKDGLQWTNGDTLIQIYLAQTLKAIRDYGREGFYSGKAAANFHQLMGQRGGIISWIDMQEYKSVWRKPIVGWYKGYKIISMPPPSSGGIALVQLLNMVENSPLKDWGWNKEKTVHLMAEAEKRIFADRSEYLGDPDFYKVPVENLLDSTYLIFRMKDFDPEKASDSKNIKAGAFLLSPLKLSEAHTSGGVRSEKEQTTHFSIIDKWHNAVSVTTTLNGSYGAGIFVPGSGFLLNNEMDDFSVKPGVPNAYGLVGAEANAIAPGKRMLSSMTPTIIEKDGKLFMVAGTPGGSTIITAVFQTILNVVEYEMTMNEAVNAKKFHHQWKPDTIYVEKEALDSLTISALNKKGHYITARNPIGRTDCILILPNGKLEGGADRRGDDTAIGY